MAGTFWLDGTGSFVVADKDGHPILCEYCPCCNEDLRDAIRERQRAIKIVDAWLPSSPTNVNRLIATCNEYKYTLFELKHYVNTIAPKFLNGTYTGGPSSPIMFTGAYATAATNEDELYSLVCALKESYFSFSVATGVTGVSPIYWNGHGEDYDLGTAKAEAEAAYGNVISPPTFSSRVIAEAYSKVCTFSFDYEVTIAVMSQLQTWWGIPTFAAHSGRLFACVGKPNMFEYWWDIESQIFDDLGQDIPAYENYFEVESFASGMWASVTSSIYLLDPTIMPDAWPNAPSLYYRNYLGFTLYTDFLLLLWDFVHV